MRAIVVALLSLVALPLEAQTSVLRSEVAALRRQLAVEDRTLDSLEARLAYLKRDSAIIYHAPLDSLPALLRANARTYWADSITVSPGSTQLRTELYVTMLAVGVTANAIGGLVRDAGGYPKQWDQWTPYHIAAGAALESVGHSMQVPAKWRLPALCGAITAWESVKGYPDWRDVVAGCSGALINAGIRRAWR